MTFFVWALLLIVHTWNSSSLRSNLLRLQFTCTVPKTFWKAPWKSSCGSVLMTFVTASFRGQCLDYWEGEELSWCPSWSNSLWQGWSSGLVHCPGGNATDPIWRVLASSDRISSWTLLKPQHISPNHNPLANQLGSIDFLTPPIPLIIPHRLPAFLESLMPLENWCSIHVRCSKSSLTHSIRFCGSIFSKFKIEFIAYRSSKVFSSPDCFFEIHQLWQSGFSRVYFNSCCSYSFEPEIIKLVSHLIRCIAIIYLNFQESTAMLNACTKMSGNLVNAPRM